LISLIARKNESLYRRVWFVFIVGVCSYVVLNPGSYSTLVLFLASLVLCMAARAVAPIGKFIFLLTTQALASDVSPWIDNRP
jgi:hypothetical protein